MITFHLDRIRYAYPIDRIPDPEVNPPQQPAATQPTQHTLITYGIVFSADHYPAALNPRDYIRPVHDATHRLFAELVIPRLDQAISNHNPT